MGRGHEPSPPEQGQARCNKENRTDTRGAKTRKGTGPREEEVVAYASQMLKESFYFLPSGSENIYPINNNYY